MRVGRKTCVVITFVLEVINERSERVKPLVNSCIDEVDRIRIRVNRKSCDVFAPLS